MNGCQGKFLTIWMILSVLTGIAGGLFTYYATSNTQQAGSDGVRYFLLAYILGWVLIKIGDYVERVRPHDEDTEPRDQ